MADRTLMGFDVGGTKTACVILNQDGKILGRGFGGGSPSEPSLRHAGSGADGAAAVPRAVCVVRAFGPAGESGQPPVGTDRPEIAEPAGQQLVRVRLMPYVPDDSVVWRMEFRMKG